MKECSEFVNLPENYGHIQALQRNGVGMQVAINELKAGLSRYVALARSGTVIEVTSHQKPVARLVGITATDSPGMQRLLSSGAVQWQGGKPTFAPPLALPGGGPSVSTMIIEDRG